MWRWRRWWWWWLAQVGQLVGHSRRGRPTSWWDWALVHPDCDDQDEDDDDAGDDDDNISNVIKLPHLDGKLSKLSLSAALRAATMSFICWQSDSSVSLSDTKWGFFPILFSLRGKSSRLQCISSKSDFFQIRRKIYLKKFWKKELGLKSLEL